MTRKRNTNRRKAVAVVWVAVTALALIGMIGLATDAAYVRTTAQQLQNTADAAALAAAVHAGYPAEARNTAIEVARANTAAKTPVQLSDNPQNNPDGDIVLGNFNRATIIFTPGIPSNAVKVVARRTASAHGPLALLFGPIFGTNTSNITRSAIAMTTTSPNIVLLVLNQTTSCALNFHGTNLDFHVMNGGVQVNSNNGCAVCTGGNPTIDTPSLNVTGNVCLSQGASVTGTTTVGVPRLPDPLANLPAPTWSTDLGAVVLTSNHAQNFTIQPGYYSGGIRMSNSNGTLTAEPGIYVLDGTGLNVTGGTLHADGVMFYIIDSTPNNSKLSMISLTGGTDIRITGPDPAIHTFSGADTYAGVTIFQARDNTNPADINGSASFTIGGTIYFPRNLLKMTGNGGSLSTRIIADTVDVGGSSSLTVDPPAAPGPPPHIFLVR